MSDSNQTLIEALEKNKYSAEYIDEATEFEEHGARNFNHGINTAIGLIRKMAIPSEIPVADPKINNALFNRCIEALGPHDDEMNRWYLDEGNIRHFLAAYVTHALPATKPVSSEQAEIWSASDLKSLDYYLWKRVGYEGAPPCNGEYEIRLQDGQVTKADYDENYAVFHIGDGEVHLSKVEWRDIYPASPVERAARAFLEAAGQCTIHSCVANGVSRTK